MSNILEDLDSWLEVARSYNPMPTADIRMVQRARREVEELRAALLEIAYQNTYEKDSELDRAADYRAGYESCVSRARLALANTDGDGSTLNVQAQAERPPAIEDNFTSTEELRAALRVMVQIYFAYVDPDELTLEDAARIAHARAMLGDDHA